MKSQIKVQVVVKSESDVYIRAKIGTKNVVLRPDEARTGGFKTYVSIDSAQRSWRKYALKHGISDYTYSLVSR